MQSETHRKSRILWGCSLIVTVMSTGCHSIPFHGTVHADAAVAGQINGQFEVKLPAGSPDAGPIVATVVRGSPGGACSSRVGVVDVDGLMLNQNMVGLYSAGENPVATFREKLEAAAADPQIRAVVLRINSPGGGVTACDIMAEELRRFRLGTGKPVVACLMDLATSGAYYLAVGADLVVAHPTTVTGGVGALFNHYNLQDAMAQFNILADTIPSGDLVDMGTVTRPLTDEARSLIEDMVDLFSNRFRTRVLNLRPGMTIADQEALTDGRVLPASRALNQHMVDRLGYIDDAIREAELLAGLSNAEVVNLHRSSLPVRSLYDIAPNRPLQGQIIPLSYPGLDRGKLPAFLYLWQTDPTVTNVVGP